MIKILFTSTLILLFHLNSFAQCCSAATATSAFASLGEQNDFSMAHEEPMPFSGVQLRGEMITFPAADGDDASAYFLSAPTESNVYVIVFQEWWGLNDYIKAESDKLYDALPNANIIAPDLYDGNIATTREQAAEYMRGSDENRIRDIIRGLASYAGDDAVFATIGWCFGGGWSLQATLMLESRSKACVMYYGMPETDLERLSALQTDVLFIHAEKDQWINNQVVTTFERNMTTVQKSLVVMRYDEDHAFANPSNPNYAKDAANNAFTNAVDFIKLNISR